MGVGKARGRRKRGVWGEKIRDRFLALLRETGNASAALRITGHANMFYKRRRRDSGFARQWAEAVAAADARLGRAESPIPERGMGTGTERERGMGTVSVEWGQVRVPVPRRE